MNQKEYVIEFDMDTQAAALGAKETVKALGEIRKAFAETAGSINRVFSLRGMRKNLEKDLLLLRLYFGKLKAAVADAAAPVMAVLVPALNQAILAATRLVRSVGKVLGALFGGAAGTDAMADSADAAAEAEDALAKSAGRAGKAVKRSLAGFDELERLDAPAAGTAVDITLPRVDRLTPQLQAVVEKINALLAPLRAIDLTPLRQALAELGIAVQAFGAVLGSTLEWAWFEILTPFAAWVTEQLAPAFTGVLASGLEAVTAALAPVAEGFGLLWEKLQPVASYIGETVVLTLESLGKQFGILTQTLTEKGETIRGIFSGIGAVVQTLWNGVRPILELLRQTWSVVMDTVGSSTAVTVGAVLDILGGLTEFIAGTLTGDWQRAWDGLKGLFKGFVNGIIGLLNSLISGIVAGMNNVIRGLNRMRFNIPDWDIFGSMAGKTFGLSLSTISAPQIPYLAKGAVLPANKPFLAVVGDQKHGKNIEAPASLIQETVASVMEDMMAGNMAGHQATVDTLQQILEAVLGIEIGDRVIGQAAQRYNRKMAMMKGGWA